MFFFFNVKAEIINLFLFSEIFFFWKLWPIQKFLMHDFWINNQLEFFKYEALNSFFAEEGMQFVAFSGIKSHEKSFFWEKLLFTFHC